MEIVVWSLAIAAVIFLPGIGGWIAIGLLGVYLTYQDWKS